jgi:hypothetical protein
VNRALQFTRDEHLTKSRQNEVFAKTIDASSGVGIEWAITVKFYAALHMVQAYFVSRTGKTPTMHANRAAAIQRDISISGAYDDYRELQDISRAARYDCSDLQAGHLRFADECLAAIKSVIGIHLPRA